MKGLKMQEKLTSEEKIRKSLLEQLEKQNKWTDYCIDLVEMYMVHWRLAQKLMQDIEKNGLRVTITSGNGFESEKPNMSIGDLQRETTIMLQILDKMNLKAPIISAPEIEDDPGDDYL